VWGLGMDGFEFVLCAREGEGESARVRKSQGESTRENAKERERESKRKSQRERLREREKVPRRC